MLGWGVETVWTGSCVIICFLGPSRSTELPHWPKISSTSVTADASIMPERVVWGRHNAATTN